MRRVSVFAPALWAVLCLPPGAPSSAAAADRVRRFAFDFADGTQGWQGGFADYAIGTEEPLALSFGEATIPDELGGAATALRISGNNISDDLFMFLKGRIDGLDAGAPYRLRFRVKLASNAPRGVAGIGGPPGEAVWVKAGAVGHEPDVVDDEGYVEMNLSKGNQAVGGADAQVIGNVAVRTAPDAPRYRWKVLRSRRAQVVTTDAQGALWLVVGTDSGFEGTTTLYYGRISVRAARAR